MADTPGKRSYPQLPLAVWWAIRDRFIQSLPSIVTEQYLATVLHIEIAAARQYQRYLKDLGLIDEDQRPTRLAQEWRDDEQYPDVCRKILDEVYPEGLRDIAPPPNPNRAEVVRWFMHSEGLGKGAAENKTAMYLLLAEANPQKTDQRRSRKPNDTATRSKTLPRLATPRSTQVNKTIEPKGAMMDGSTRVSPALQLNIELHISPQMSPEQIDKIFESMAKHLNIR